MKQCWHSLIGFLNPPLPPWECQVRRGQCFLEPEPLMEKLQDGVGTAGGTVFSPGKELPLKRPLPNTAVCQLCCSGQISKPDLISVFLSIEKAEKIILIS